MRSGVRIPVGSTTRTNAEPRSQRGLQDGVHRPTSPWNGFPMNQPRRNGAKRGTQTRTAFDRASLGDRPAPPFGLRLAEPVRDPLPRHLAPDHRSSPPTATVGPRPRRGGVVRHRPPVPSNTPHPCGRESSGINSLGAAHQAAPPRLLHTHVSRRYIRTASTRR